MSYVVAGVQVWVAVDCFDVLALFIVNAGEVARLALYFL